MEFTTKEQFLSYVKSLEDIENHTKRSVIRKHFKSKYGLHDPWDYKFNMTWNEVKHHVGWATDPTPNKLTRHAKKHFEADSIRQASNDRLEWGSLFVNNTNRSRFKTLIGAGDFHDIECDPFALRMFIEKIKAVQPDVVSIHGDMFDAPEFSSHFQDIREYKPLERIKAVHNIFEQIREVAPNTQIDLIEGNHEVRISKFILENDTTTATILSGLHGMGIREILGLDKYRVNYIAKGDLFAFNDRDLRKYTGESEKIYWDTLWVRHHPPLAKDVSLPGFHGHHHKLEVKSYFNPIYGSFQWYQLGGMHKRKACYTDGRKWNIGFVTCLVDTEHKRVNFDYTDVGEHTCINGGRVYQRSEDEYD